MVICMKDTGKGDTLFSEKSLSKHKPLLPLRLLLAKLRLLILREVCSFGTRDRSWRWEQGKVAMTEEPNSDGAFLPDSGKIGSTISSTSPTPLFLPERSSVEAGRPSRASPVWNV